jgi:hypothetical protein
MFDSGSKGILGEVYSSNFGVVGQGIDDRLDTSGRSGGCCLSCRRHEEDGLDGLFKLLRSEGMVRGEGKTTIQGTIDGQVQGPELNGDGACLPVTFGRLIAISAHVMHNRINPCQCSIQLPVRVIFETNPSKSPLNSRRIQLGKWSLVREVVIMTFTVFASARVSKLFTDWHRYVHGYAVMSFVLSQWRLARLCRTARCDWLSTGRIPLHETCKASWCWAASR